MFIDDAVKSKIRWLWRTFIPVTMRRKVWQLKCYCVDKKYFFYKKYFFNQLGRRSLANKTTVENIPISSGRIGICDKLARRLSCLTWLPRARSKVASAWANRGRVKPGSVTFVGFFGSALGLGEAARLHQQAFHRAGIPTDILDISGIIARRDFSPPASPSSRPRSGGVTILHVNAPETFEALRRLRAAQRGRRSLMIGYWFWELPVLPPAWRTAAYDLHEIWVSTTFCANAIRPSVDIPVRVVPLAPCCEPLGPGRAEFGLPDDAFICLCTFDMRSSLARKNPLGAVRAFKGAFRNDPNALLVIKAHSIDYEDPAFCELMTEIAPLANVRMIDTVLSRQKMHHLVQCADVALSLHRAEGLGLLMAEAMAYGRVAVATGWSGNMDFMNETNSMPVLYSLVPVIDPQGIYSLDTHWAEPNLADASAKLKQLRDNPILRDQLGRQAAATMAAFASPESHLEACGEAAQAVIADKR